MGKYIGRIFIPAILVLLALPPLATGKGNIFPDFDVLTKDGFSTKPGDLRIGRIKLHPGFAFETRYETNVFEEADREFQFGAEEGRADDFIFTNKPSMEIVLDRAPGEVFGFFFNYLGRDEHFLERDETQDFFNHRVGGGFNLGGPGGRGDLTIGGSWEKAAGSTSRDFDSNIGNRQARTTNYGYAKLVYSLSKLFKLELEGNGQDNKYQGRPTNNVDEFNAGGGFFWQATKPMAIGIKYNHKIRRYELQPPPLTRDDSKADQVYLALRWEPTSLISGEVAVGYDTKRYETFEGDNSQNLVYLLDLVYKPVKRTQVTLESKREIVDSTFGTIQSYVLSSVTLGLTQKMGKKLKGLIDLEYENRDYRRSALDGNSPGGSFAKIREDHSIAGTASLRYRIQKWLEARVSYEYEETISNFDSREFKNHIATMEIGAKY